MLKALQKLIHRQDKPPDHSCECFMDNNLRGHQLRAEGDLGRNSGALRSEIKGLLEEAFLSAL